jgi:HlyD family secretion protein
LLALVIIGLWPESVPVEAGVVSRGELRVTVDEEGMTRLRHRYVLSAPVSGQMQRIDLKPGALVEAGRTIITRFESGGADFLDARSLQQAEARVSAARAAREAAAAQRERVAAGARLQATELERARLLRERGVISAQEFDAAALRAETAAQEARAAGFALQVAEYEWRQAQALLGRGQGTTVAEALPITAPVSGRILRVMQESSRLVAAGTPLVELGDPVDLEVRIEVLSRDGVAIQPGSKVVLEQWGGAEPLLARVRLVEPAAFTKISALGVEEQRVYVIADLEAPPEKRPTLGDSYRVEAHIVVWESSSAVRIPAGALFRRGGDWHAFVVSAGRAQLRRVEIGRSNGVQAEVKSGVREGESVVMYPGDKVVHGVRVSSLGGAGR